MLKKKLFRKIGTVLTAASLLISSQAITFAQEESGGTFEYPELAASWDFTEEANSDFTVKYYDGNASKITLDNSQGKLNWYDYLYTKDNFQNAVLEFDYKIHANKPDTERRIRIFLGVDENQLESNNYIYIDFIKDTGDKPHIVVNGADWGYFNADSEYKFYQDTVYNFRYAVSGDSVRIWAKTETETEYTYIGERTGLNIPRGRIGIHSHDWGYIDNLKVYADTLKVSINNGDYIPADNAKIDVTLINDVEITDANITLKQNGSLIACQFSRDGKNLTVTPAALEPDKEYTLWISEEVSGEPSGRTIAFKTLPDVAACYDFANGVNDGFDVKTIDGNGTTVATDNGEGKLWWDCIPITQKGYQKAIMDFDFRWNSADDGRLSIYFGVESFGNSAYFSYINFDSDSNSPHFCDNSNGDGFFTNGSGFGFEKNIDYSVRYIVESDFVKLYAKKVADTDYTYVGERTGISIPKGKIKIYCDKQFINAKSIKVYANTTKLSIKDGATVPAELANITVTLPTETAADNSQIKLTQNGNKVSYTFAQSGRTLTIKPILKPQKQYVLWLSESITGEAGGVTVTFNTMPAVSAYYDFTNNVNYGFNVKNSLTVADGEGKMSWDTTIITSDSYKNAILDFDYRLESYKGETRFKVCFGEDENGTSTNFCYIDINGNSQPIFHKDDGDYSFKNGSGFVFKDGVTYSFRYIVSNDAVKFYAKEADAEEYTFVGEVTGLNIPSGRMSINGKEYGYIKNLKVYGYVTDNYDYVIKNASYDPETKTFTADVESVAAAAGEAKAAIAAYSDSSLIDVKIVDINNTNTSVSETLEAGSEYKVMVLESFSNLKPMAECVAFN